jgi:hypothetical protein
MSEKKPLGKPITVSARKAKTFTAPPIPKRLPKQTEPDTVVPAGQHPTPSAPIPVYDEVPRGNFKGPIHVVSKRRRKGK